MEKNNLGFGVYYRNGDYADFASRAAVMLVDLLFILLFSFIATGILWGLAPRRLNFPAVMIEIIVLFSFFYLTIIKASKLRTLGYILIGVRIVDLKGKRPSFFKMVFRYLLLTLGPLSLIPDILWLIGEPTKQTFRDKVSGTYVIKKDAEPMGTGAMHLKYYHITSFHIIVPEVKKEDTKKKGTVR